MSDDTPFLFGDPHVKIDGVDVTSYISSFRIDLLANRPPIAFVPIDLRTPKQIMGEAQTTLSPDEWAALSEHIVISDEPGEF